MTIKPLTAETPPDNYIHQTLSSKIKALEFKNGKKHCSSLMSDFLGLMIYFSKPQLPSQYNVSSLVAAVLQ